MSGGIEQAITRHQIQLQRLAGGNYRKILPILKRLSNDLKLAVLETLDPTSVRSEQIVKAQIDAIVKSMVSDMRDILEPEFADLAAYEAQFIKNIYAPFITVEMSGVSAEVIKAAISNKKMALFDNKGRVTKMSINMALQKYGDKVALDMIQEIRGGIIMGATTRQIATNVSRWSTSTTRQQAETLVRTTTNHVGDIARREFYRENSSIIGKERYVATLDSRTTLICAGNDGKEFDLGVGPIPPLHWNCRSIRVAIVEDKYKLPGVAETRASIEGPVSAKTTYSSFLKQQSKEFQDNVLGKERAKLFRSGKIPLDKFTDHGRVLTLDELKRIEKTIK